MQRGASKSGFGTMQALPDWYLALQQDCVSRHELCIAQQRAADVAQTAKFDLLFSMISDLHADVKELKAANVSTTATTSSSSGSSEQLSCPLRCSAQFKKVPHYLESVVITLS
jgi:hypothetical protein